MSTLSIVDQNIIFTLNHIQGMENKKYCYPSQNKILVILKTIYHNDICLRTLNYHLAKLERLHYIYRKRRNPLNRNGFKVYQTTLYSLSLNAYLFLTSVLNTLKNGYYSIKKFLQRKYISSRKEKEEDQRYLSPDENIRRLKEVINKLDFSLGK